MACASSGPNDHHQWNVDLYSMLVSEAGIWRGAGFSLIALGDFNARVGKIPGLENNNSGLNSNTTMFKAFIKSLDLTILNTLPIG